MINQDEQIQDWIEQGLQGKQEAFHHIYNHFVKGVYRLCYSLVPNHHDAEDVLQDAFVYAFKNLDKFDSNKASFKTWLYTIAVSRCRNTYRRKQPILVELSHVLSLQIPSDNTEQPEQAMMRQDMRHQIEQALQTLSITLREAVILRYGHGLTYREIAEVMECPQKTAESRVRLAHQQLRQALSANGHAHLQETLSGVW